MWIYNVGMGLFDLHGLLLCVSEGFLSQKMWIRNEGMETFGLHELISCVPEGVLS